MATNDNSKVLSVQTKAREFLNKKTTEIECIPIEDIQALVFELVRCLNSVATPGLQPKTAKGEQEETPGQGSLSINEKGFIIKADGNMARMLGKDPQSLKRHRIQKFIDRPFKKRFNQHYLDACESRSEQNCQIRFVSTEGRSFLATMKSTPRFDEKGSFIKLDSSVRFTWESF